MNNNNNDFLVKYEKSILAEKCYKMDDDQIIVYFKTLVEDDTLFNPETNYLNSRQIYSHNLPSRYIRLRKKNICKTIALLQNKKGNLLYSLPNLVFEELIQFVKFSNHEHNNDILQKRSLLINKSIHDLFIEVDNIYSVRFVISDVVTTEYFHNLELKSFVEWIGTILKEWTKRIQEYIYKFCNHNPSSSNRVNSWDEMGRILLSGMNTFNQIYIYIWVEYCNFSSTDLQIIREILSDKYHIFIHYQLETIRKEIVELKCLSLSIFIHNLLMSKFGFDIRATYIDAALK